MTDLVEAIPPEGIPLRHDRPTYQYGEYWIGMVDSLKFKTNRVWLAYNANGLQVAYAPRKEKLLAELDQMMVAP